MICPLASTELTGLAANTGMSWWQTAGGLVAVFGLLLLSLRLLGRFQKNRGGDRAGMLTVWPLGPKREIQVLRLGDAVHYVYRHDGAMVVLEQETLAAWESRADAETPRIPSPQHTGMLDMRRWRAMASRSGESGSLSRTPAS
ncbi:hypothetical protein DRQ50_01500 [bacterium]|nr:MAG: hypothetical protein DRQ50_01500 [bacterium]